MFRFDSSRPSASELLIILTPHVVRNAADAERLRQIEAARMHWCAADVHELHGDPAFCRRGDCPICDAEMPVIYPDFDPSGMQPTPMPEMEQVYPGEPAEVPAELPEPGVSADAKTPSRRRWSLARFCPSGSRPIPSRWIRFAPRPGRTCSVPGRLRTRCPSSDEMLKSHAAIWLCIAALFAGFAGGCAQFKVPKKLTLPGDDKPQAPFRMTALWTDTVLVEAGVVGFGGRIMFYGSNDEEPILVEGELTVFAYDDSLDIRADSVPARKFVFRAEELKKHYSKSTLGHSYSFWIPWDKVGGQQRQISLIARFKRRKAAS